MPKTTRQRRGEIIASLRHLPTITSDDLEQALADAEIESPNGIKAYTAKLESLGYLIRVAGGWELAAAAKETGTIVIKVFPDLYTADVRKAISAAIRPFRTVTTMEIDA